MLTIGRLGEAGAAIRYYERIGLLREPERSAGNQRMLSQFAFIRHARELGFPLDAIRDLLSLSDQPDRPCAAWTPSRRANCRRCAPGSLG